MISFQQITDAVARGAASKWAVAAAFFVVVAWAATGPHFHWSDSHSLFINTLTTIVTFWLGFLILAAQYRGDKAISVKLDELIRAGDGANNRLIALENKPQDEIERASEEVKAAATDPRLIHAEGCPARADVSNPCTCTKEHWQDGKAV